MSARSVRRRLRRRVRAWRASPAVRRTGVVAGLLVGFGLLWIVVTGLLVRQQLSDLSLRLQQVRYLVSEGKVAEARQLAQDVPAMAARAHRLTTGPAWWVAAHVLYLGEPLDVMRDVTAVSDDVGAHAVPRLVTVIATLDPQKLRAGGASIRTGPLIAIRPQLHAAADVLDSASRRFGAIESDTWFGPVDSKRNQIDDQLQLIRGYVDAAARTSDILPTMLGSGRTQRYFVGLQTEAELRGTGGLPGAFTIVSASKGRLTFERFESDTILLPKKQHNRVPTGLDFGRDYDTAYGASQPTSSYVDSNVSPHFPYAAQIWAAMWQKVSGQRVDGVLAIDPTVLSYLLAVTGPIQLPGVTGPINGANVVRITQSEEYALFSDNTSRKNFNVALLKAVAHRLTSGAGRPVGLLRAVISINQWLQIQSGYMR